MFAAKRICLLSPSAEGNAVLAQYLEELKCLPSRYADPHEALRAVRAAMAGPERYDAFIVDSELPDISGFRFAQSMRADPIFGPLKIIVVIPAGKRGKTTEIMKKGIDGYLAKPFRRNHIADCLSLVFDAPAAGNQSAPSPIASRPGPSVTNAKKQYRILLAEDNAVIQTVIKRLLAKYGYSCDLAVNGAQACEAHQKAGYDLILMDCQMPVLSGFDATRAIRAAEAATPGAKHTAIIALTANALQEDKLRCLKAGMDDYLSKPINSNELIAKIDSWCAAAHRG
jgi:CheY-like chemotaxis protein